MTAPNEDELSLTEKARPRLLPLTPEYDPSLHKTYLDMLEAGLDGPESTPIRNIAVTGSYGSGKSSILEGLSRKKRDEIVFSYPSSSA